MTVGQDVRAGDVGLVVVGKKPDRAAKTGADKAPNGGTLPAGGGARLPAGHLSERR